MKGVCRCDKCENLTTGKFECNLWRNNGRPRKMLNCPRHIPSSSKAPDAMFEPEDAK